jgi:uncharacterized membrane protein (DUF106 family)
MTTDAVRLATIEEQLRGHLRDSERTESLIFTKLKEIEENQKEIIMTQSKILETQYKQKTYIAGAASMAVIIFSAAWALIKIIVK